MQDTTALDDNVNALAEVLGLCKLFPKKTHGTCIIAFEDGGARVVIKQVGEYDVRDNLRIIANLNNPLKAISGNVFWDDENWKRAHSAIGGYERRHLYTLDPLTENFRLKHKLGAKAERLKFRKLKTGSELFEYNANKLLSITLTVEQIRNLSEIKAEKGKLAVSVKKSILSIGTEKIELPKAFPKDIKPLKLDRKLFQSTVLYLVESEIEKVTFTWFKGERRKAQLNFKTSFASYQYIFEG